jgi:hypothetical protein
MATVSSSLVSAHSKTDNIWQRLRRVCVRQGWRNVERSFEKALKISVLENIMYHSPNQPCSLVVSADKLLPLTNFVRDEPKDNNMRKV